MICIELSSAVSARAEGRDRTHAFSSRLISLRNRQSVPLSDDPVGGRLDHVASWSRNAKNRIVSSGSYSRHAAVRDLVQRLERVIITRPDSGIDQPSRGPSRLGAAEVGGLRMARTIAWSRSDASGRTHCCPPETAEILRPWAVDRAIDDDVAEAAGARSWARAGSREKPRSCPPRTGPSACGSMLVTQSMSLSGSRPT